ncbi:MAG: cytochrome ubiquinol oxidase subunit I [Janthinobacterium lividum]
MLDHLDGVALARAQFAFTVSFHFIFPAFSIGLASFLFVLEALWLKTGSAVYQTLYNYWLKIFAVAFGMGVVSGIVMSYQFGTNWSVFSAKAGPIVGPLMAYEVLTAFFLEAGFLGVMLFGQAKVGKELHFFATGMVALGTLVSATWIISVNSWMQTPAGFAINAHGQFVPAGSWLPIIFNPSFPYRLVHTVIAAYLTTALVVGAVGAHHLLRNANDAAPRRMFSMAMWLVTILTPLQILAGDAQGLNTLKYQPTKVLAMEGDYDASPHGAPLVLFGLPSNAEGRVRYKLEVPHVGSLILMHDAHAPLPGLKDFPRSRWAPVPIVFWSFRVMVGLGFAMFALGISSFFARWRGRLFETRLLHRAALAMGPAGFVAVIAGWVTTEVGRQPYTVFGYLLTADSHSPLAAPAIAASLASFALVYFAVFGAGIVYVIRLMAALPAPGEEGPASIPQRAAGVTPAPALEPLVAEGAAS